MEKHLNKMVLTDVVESANRQWVMLMPAKIEVDEVEFTKDCQIMRGKELCKKYGISWTKAKDLKKRLGLTDGKTHDRKITYEIDGDGCWICTSHKTNDHGYPQGNCKKGRKSIAKVMWSEKNGIWPEGKSCIHSCDNRLCINPEHVYPGIRKENSEDMYNKNRSCWGFRSGARKLTPVQAKEIYGLKDSGLSERKVGDLYNINGATVHYLWRGVTWWRDVEGVNNFEVPLNMTLVGEKLKLREVQSILSLKGKLSERKVAKIYRISNIMVHKIWSGKSWKDIPVREVSNDKSHSD
jgi:hypothetical protein